MKDHFYRQNKDMVFREEGDEALLFNPDNSDVIVINETGCFIWGLCNGRHTEQKMAEKITAVYEVGIEDAKKDLVEYLKVLEKANFIKSGS